MTLARKLTSNIAYAVVGRIFNAVFGLATTAIMARSLGPDVFGLFRTAFAWSTMTCILANMGLEIVCLREISRPGADIPRTVGTVLGLRLAVGAVCTLLAAGIVWFVPQPDAAVSLQLSYAAWIAAVGSVAMLGNEIITTIFQQSLTQKRASLAELAGGAATLAFVMLAVAIDGGLLAFTAATAGGFVVTTLASAALAERIAPVRPRFDLVDSRRLVISGLPLFGSEILGMVTARVDTVLLSLLSAATQVGYYGIANKIREIAVRLPFLLASLLMPVLTRAAGEPDTFRRYLGDAIIVIWIFAVAVIVGLGCYADVIVTLLAGPQFLDAADAVRITGFTLAAGSLAAILEFAAYALERAGGALRVKAVSSAVALVGLLMLVPGNGAVGTATAVLLGEATFAVGLIRLATPDGRRVMPWPRMALTALVGAVCAALALLLLRAGVPWFIGVAALMVAYPVLLLLFRVTTIEQLRTLTAKQPPG